MVNQTQVTWVDGRLRRAKGKRAYDLRACLSSCRGIRGSYRRLAGGPFTRTIERTSSIQIVCKHHLPRNSLLYAASVATGVAQQTFIALLSPSYTGISQQRVGRCSFRNAGVIRGANRGQLLCLSAPAFFFEEVNGYNRL